MGLRVRALGRALTAQRSPGPTGQISASTSTVRHALHQMSPVDPTSWLPSLAPTKEERRGKGRLMDHGAGGGGSQQAMAGFYFPLNPCQPVGMIAFVNFGSERAGKSLGEQISGGSTQALARHLGLCWSSSTPSIGGRLRGRKGLRSPECTSHFSRFILNFISIEGHMCVKTHHRPSCQGH